MAEGFDRQRRKRIVIQTPPRRQSRDARRMTRGVSPGLSEGLVAASVIGAAALATFMALFLTSRPYDPMNSTVAPRTDVPQSSLMLQSSPKPTSSAQPSAKPTATPAAATEPGGLTVPDDAGIQAEIEKRISGDSTLSSLDVSTIVEGGKVTLVGSVKSQD